MKITEILLILIVLIMTLQKGRIRLLFKILFCLCIGSFIYGEINNKYKTWTFDEYSLENMEYFFTTTIYDYYSLWAVLLSALFMFLFYVVLKAIAINIFSKKEKDEIYNKRSDLILEKFTNGHECATKIVDYFGFNKEKNEYKSADLINKKIDDWLFYINLFMSMIVLDVLTVLSIIICSVLLFMVFFARPIIEIVYKKIDEIKDK